MVRRDPGHTPSVSCDARAFWGPPAAVTGPRVVKLFLHPYRMQSPAGVELVHPRSTVTVRTDDRNRRHRLGHVRVTVTFEWTLLSRRSQLPNLNLALQCAPPWQDGAFGVDGLPTPLVGSNWLSELAALRRAHRANWIPREVPATFDPQVRLLSVSAGTFLDDATCGPQAWLTGTLHGGGIRSVRSPPRRAPLLAAPIAKPLQCGRP